jgi:Spy/CpxP family protein refolding chaperone
MKRLLIIVFALSFSSSYAQRPSGQHYDKEKLEAARIAFITNRLDLKSAQAEKFWPLYNKYNEERGEIMGQISEINRNSTQEINDAKAKEMIQQRLKLQQQLLDKEKVFMEEITRIITPVQAIKLGSVNREFTRQVYRMHQGGERGRKN